MDADVDADVDTRRCRCRCGCRDVDVDVDIDTFDLAECAGRVGTPSPQHRGWAARLLLILGLLHHLFLCPDRCATLRAIGEGRESATAASRFHALSAFSVVVACTCSWRVQSRRVVA